MAIFSEKTVILAAPRHYNIDSVIEKELVKLGFRTINISFYDNQYKYRSSWERIECFLMKNLLWKRDYKTRLSFNANEAWISNKLQEIDHADYALIIRPDVYPVSFIAQLRKKTDKLVGYQWDGLKRFPQVYTRIPLFDRFFVFNRKDLNTPSVLPITNFYPSAPLTNLHDFGLQSEIFYSGYFIKCRVKTLGKIIRDSELLGKKVSYHLFLRKRTNKVDADSGLKISDVPLSYEQSIQHTLRASTIIDLVSAVHEGLSFRVFEALGYEKKLITTNKYIKDYDFYHPNNIFIWDHSEISELEAFFALPYITLPVKIKEKYGFANWIQYALDEGEYTPLTIPV